MDLLGSVHRDKENSKKGKLLREYQTGVSSPARTPLGDVRNKLPTDSYVNNIRKTLYGTPVSSKQRTPLSGLAVRTKTTLSSSKEWTPKCNPSLKQNIRIKGGQSDKKAKVVRFNLKEEVCCTPPGYDSIVGESNGDGEVQDEVEKLDREIEGFISSILKLTVEEIRKEQQEVPVIKVIAPTPIPEISPHEDTPKTAEVLAKQFNIEFKETSNKSSAKTGAISPVKLAVKNNQNSPMSCSESKNRSKIPVSVDQQSSKHDRLQGSPPSTVKRYISLLKNLSPQSSKKITRETNICPKLKSGSSTFVATNSIQSSPTHGLSVSILTSPILASSVGHQITEEKACSPMVLQRTTEETNTDPRPLSVDVSMTTDSFTPVKVERNIQVDPDLTSTASSPFRCLVKDVEMMTVLQETCDISMITENVDVVSHGIMVKPECEDKSTLTDVASRRTSETSMTPVKALSKSGKRLTAEEVRRQHPRAIANQLDTTLVCNERLKSDLKHVEKERDKLKCIVKDLRASLSTKHKLIEELESQKESDKSELEEMHFNVVREFQTKVQEKDQRIEILETEVQNLKSLVVDSEMEYQNFKSTLQDRCDELQSQLDSQDKRHLEQVQELEADFQQNNYKAQFERSQQMIRELQAQLDEFADIMAELEVTEKLQDEVHSTMSETHKKLRHAGVKNAEMRKKLITEYVSMQKMKKELTKDVENFKLENQSLRDECESLVTSLTMSHDSIAQLQSLYSSTSNDLLQATSQVCQMNVELAGARKALQDLLLTKDLLLHFLTEQTEKEEKSTKQIISLKEELAQLDDMLKEEQKRKEDWERIAVDGRAAFQDKTDEYELCITNLQRTLDYRDQDIDILEKDLYECREIILEQRHQMDELEKKYKALKENVDIQLTDQTELKALRDSVEFLEAERGMLIDSLRDSEEKIRSTFLQLNQQQKTLSDAQIQFQQYDMTILNLQKEVLSTKKELETTQSQAREMILKYDKEMRCSGEAVGALEEKMYTILGVLKKKVGVEVDEDQTEENFTPSKFSSESLVSKVLKAVNTSNTADTSQVDTSFSWSKSRPRSEDSSPSEGSSQNMSSQDSGYLNSNSFTSPGEVSRSKLGYSNASAFAPVRSKTMTSVNSGSGMTEGFAENDEEKSLVKQIDVLGTVLSGIVSMANILEKASELSLQDLKGENSLLRNKVTQLEGEVLRLQQDRNYKTDELTEANGLIEELKGRIREMGDRIITLSDYQFEHRTVRQEVERLLSEVKRLEGEKDILTEQLNQQNQSSLSHDQHVARGVHMQGEMLSLKRKNQQLLLQLNEERDRYQDMGNKAARKMKILEENWKKAEAEVIRFDELVDSIQKILDDNKDFISRNPELLRLMRVINGEETLHTTQLQKPSLPKMPKF